MPTPPRDQKRTFFIDEGVLMCISRQILEQEDEKKCILEAFNDAYFMHESDDCDEPPFLVKGECLGKNGEPCSIHIKPETDSEFDHCNCCYIFALWLLEEWAKFHKFEFCSSLPTDCLCDCKLGGNACNGLCGLPQPKDDKDACKDKDKDKDDRKPRRKDDDDDDDRHSRRRRRDDDDDYYPRRRRRDDDDYYPRRRRRDDDDDYYPRYRRGDDDDRRYHDKDDECDSCRHNRHDQRRHFDRHNDHDDHHDDDHHDNHGPV